MAGARHSRSDAVFALQSAIEGREWDACTYLLEQHEDLPRLHLDGVLELLQAPDSMTVLAAIEALGRGTYSKTQKARVLNAIWRASCQSDFLVRAAMAEVAEDLGDQSHESELRSLVEDRSPLVRSWAAHSLVTLHPTKAKRVLLRRLPNERFLQPKAEYFAGLVRLGHRKWLPDLLGLLRSRNYRVRCAVARLVPEALGNASRQDAHLALVALEKALAREKTAAAEGPLTSAVASMRKRCK